jgi:DNA-directed RNA polymerase I, II, and III subunit RPABC1
MEKAYETCVEMIQQRGYVIIDQDDERILATRENRSTGSEQQICVFLTNTSKFNVESIQEYIGMMKKMEVWHCIIVYRDSATPVAKKIVEETKDMVIELFTEDELQYNITKHYLVPKHEIAYKKGTVGCVNFKKKYSDNIPIILKNDPISRFYGYERGDIIKVIRKNGYVMYRIVK